MSRKKKLTCPAVYYKDTLFGNGARCNAAYTDEGQKASIGNYCPYDGNLFDCVDKGVRPGLTTILKKHISKAREIEKRKRNLAEYFERFVETLKKN